MVPSIELNTSNCQFVKATHTQFLSLFGSCSWKSLLWAQCNFWKENIFLWHSFSEKLKSTAQYTILSPNLGFNIFWIDFTFQLLSQWWLIYENILHMKEMLTSLSMEYWQLLRHSFLVSNYSHWELGNKGNLMYV